MGIILMLKETLKDIAANSKIVAAFYISGGAQLLKHGYQIGEASKITGISKDTLHFYIKSRSGLQKMQRAALP